MPPTFPGAETRPGCASLAYCALYKIEFDCGTFAQHLSYFPTVITLAVSSWAKLSSRLMLTTAITTTAWPTRLLLLLLLLLVDVAWSSRSRWSRWSRTTIWCSLPPRRLLLVRRPVTARYIKDAGTLTDSCLVTCLDRETLTVVDQHSDQRLVMPNADPANVVDHHDLARRLHQLFRPVRM